MSKISILIILSILFRLLFIVLMPSVYSIDMHSWVKVTEVLRNGGNPYAETTVLNWPPLWMTLLYAIMLVADFTHLGVIILIQIFLIAVECIVIEVTYKLIAEIKPNINPFWILFVGIVINPAAVFMVCQHGNFDVLLVLWLLLFALYFIRFNKTEKETHWYASCFFLGLGILTKTIPIILVPFLIFRAKKVGIIGLVNGLVLLVGPVVVGMGIIFWMAPKEVLENVVNYRSLSGWFGITGLLALGKFWKLNAIYQQFIMPCLVFFAIFIAWLSVEKKGVNAKAVILGLFLILLSLPLFGPGYAPQYLYWFLPFGIILYSVFHVELKWMGIAVYTIMVLTYVFEYSVLESHGAFLKEMMHSKTMDDFSYQWGGQPFQVALRLPIFAAYLCMFVKLFTKLKAVHN